MNEVKKWDDGRTSYVGNRLLILRAMLERPRRGWTEESVKRQQFFLETLYHHFIPVQAKRRTWMAVRWLHGFLNQYPDVGMRRLQTAKSMLDGVTRVLVDQHVEVE